MAHAIDIKGRGKGMHRSSTALRLIVCALSACLFAVPLCASAAKKRVSVTYSHKASSSKAHVAYAARPATTRTYARKASYARKAAVHRRVPVELARSGREWRLIPHGEEEIGQPEMRRLQRVKPED